MIMNVAMKAITESLLAAEDSVVVEGVVTPGSWDVGVVSPPSVVPGGETVVGSVGVLFELISMMLDIMNYKKTFSKMINYLLSDN